MSWYRGSVAMKRAKSKCASGTEFYSDHTCPRCGARDTDVCGPHYAKMCEDRTALLAALKDAVFGLEAMRVQMGTWNISPAFNAEGIEARSRSAIAKAEAAS